MSSGEKNYITPEGAKKLQEELRKLLHEERPAVVQTVSWAASNGDRSENADYIYGKRRLREIDRRARFLTQRLEIAVVVDPACHGDAAVVRFGARVRVEDESGKERQYQLVGVDESNPAEGKISWNSPLGKALLNKKAGDAVVFKTPGGEQELVLVSISYRPDGRE